MLDFVAGLGAMPVMALGAGAAVAVSAGAALAQATITNPQSVAAMTVRRGGRAAVVVAIAGLLVGALSATGGIVDDFSELAAVMMVSVLSVASGAWATGIRLVGLLTLAVALEAGIARRGWLTAAGCGLVGTSYMLGALG